MDVGDTIARTTRTVVSSVAPDAVCVKLCEYNPRRVLLWIESTSGAGCQPNPPGSVIDPTVQLPCPIFNDILMPLVLSDHGPLVQCEWWNGISPGGSPVTVIEVIDLGCLPSSGISIPPQQSGQDDAQPAIQPIPAIQFIGGGTNGNG